MRMGFFALQGITGRIMSTLCIICKAHVLMFLAGLPMCMTGVLLYVEIQRHLIASLTKVLAWLTAGLLSARGSSTVSGRAQSATGTRLEKLVRSGLAGPVVEALATYKQDLENIQCVPGFAFWLASSLLLTKSCSPPPACCVLPPNGLMRWPATQASNRSHATAALCTGCALFAR